MTVNRVRGELFKEKDVLTYSGIHKWITRIAGSPSWCEECGDNSDRKYQWADLSRGSQKKFKKDRSNWKRLCIPCHKKYDLQGICMAGRKSVVQKTRDNNVVRVFSGIIEASNETGILMGAIHNNLSGRSKTAGGFKWERI